MPVRDPGPLLDLIPDENARVWMRRQEGLIGWGEAARCPSASLEDADRWWSELVERSLAVSTVPDPPAGAGLVAFGSFVFDPAHTRSTSSLVVPRTILGVRDGQAWLTQVSSPSSPHAVLPDPTPIRAPVDLSYLGGALSAEAWAGRVTEAVGRINAGQLDKVVLARDLLAVTEEEIDVRWLVNRLADRYARCWTFSIDGLVGASPEMLVRRERGLVTSRVLAGTMCRTGQDLDEHRRRLAAALTQSSKDRAEHDYAVRSVAEALGPFCSAMNVPEAPFVLDLPNVLHLATDVTGAARPGASSLALAAALHPSAAVCGTPTPVARATIAELEELDRGRYLGPVGWIDAQGDGEWAIALRCGQLDDDRHRMRLYAGGGIVAGSDPEAELAETTAKFLPMRYALGR